MLAKKTNPFILSSTTVKLEVNGSTITAIPTRINGSYPIISDKKIMVFLDVLNCLQS